MAATTVRAVENPWLERLALSAGDENLATQLRPIATRDPRRLWFRGREHYFDAFVDLEAGEVVWFQFTLRGCALTWTPTSLAAGYTNEFTKRGFSGSTLIAPAAHAAALAEIVADLLADCDQPLLRDMSRRLRADN